MRAKSVWTTGQARRYRWPSPDRGTRKATILCGEATGDEEPLWRSQMVASPLTYSCKTLALAPQDGDDRRD